jgi:hypothetical protein
MRFASLLRLVPLLGVLELALHQYFATRSPTFDDYAELGRRLLQVKPPGTPVVVAPAWAEPLVRQAAPGAFPIAELARADDASFASFLEVSVLGQNAPELAPYPIQKRWSLGSFELALHQNLRHERVLFDFVSALEDGRVDVFERDDVVHGACRLVSHAHVAAGGLHGHVAYPKERYECPSGGFVAAGLIEDEHYRPRRCLLARLLGAGLTMRFASVPATHRLVGFAGFSYFLERDVTTPEVQIDVRRRGAPLGSHRVVGARGWTRFELAGFSEPEDLEVSLHELTSAHSEPCFALEAR